jgi:hypothetical protein
MARGVNKVIIIGNLGADPEVRYMTNGKAMASMSVATSESWKDRESGEQARSILLHDLHSELAKINALPAKMVQSQDFSFLEDQVIKKMSAGAEDY